MSTLRILIVDDEVDIANSLARLAKEAGFDQAEVAESPSEAKEKWKSADGFDAIVLDLKMGGDDKSGFLLLQELRSGGQRPRRVFINSGHLKDLLLPCQAVQTDVISFHPKSEKSDVIKDQMEAFVTAHMTSLRAKVNFESPTWQEFNQLIKYLAKSELCVLLIGQTGAGKTVFAKLLAEASGCPADRTIHINCAAIPENLLESELFGHRKGSFTGASEDKLGKFLVASGFSHFSDGTLVAKLNARKSKATSWGAIILDEVGALPLHLQAKLLSVLDGSPIDPVGNSGHPGFVPNFRVFAATNELDKLGDSKLFRKDLRHRLQGWVVRVPDVSEQQDLIAKILEQHDVFFRNDAGGRDKMSLEWDSEAKKFLLGKNCLSQIEGGFREIKNIIARAALYASMEKTKTVTKEMVEKALQHNIQLAGSCPVAASTSTAHGTSSENEAASKITDWLTERGISTKKLDYKSLVKVIPMNKYQDFLNFVSAEFTGKNKDQNGFLTVMGRGLNLKKPVPANTVRSAFTNELKKTANGAGK